MMAIGSPIEWLQRPGTQPVTVSYTLGCTPRGPECDNCFARYDTARQQHLPGRSGLVVRDETGRLAFTGKVIMVPQHLDMLASVKTPCTVFANDLADLMDSHVSNAYLAAIWCRIWWSSDAGRLHPMQLVRWPLGRGTRRRPVHTYIVLTKIPVRLRSFVTYWWGDMSRRTALIREARDQGWCTDVDVQTAPDMDPAPTNLWLGTSAGLQTSIDARLPVLATTPAAVRVLSAEPLLGPVDVSPWMGALDWVITGGESKNGSRPPHPQWVRDLRDQCADANKPFFFKQWGDWSPGKQWGDWSPGHMGRVPLAAAVHVALDGTRKPALNITGTERRGGVVMYPVGKKTAGALLDGVEYRQWPDEVAP